MVWNGNLLLTNRACDGAEIVFRQLNIAQMLKSSKNVEY